LGGVLEQWKRSTFVNGFDAMQKFKDRKELNWDLEEDIKGKLRGHFSFSYRDWESEEIKLSY